MTAMLHPVVALLLLLLLWELLWEEQGRKEKERGRKKDDMDLPATTTMFTTINVISVVELEIFCVATIAL